ncbi:hypothetical protein AB0K52_23805 [Glycomyces sp. NPDC049804]|uniref:hypothetical protein n=1 Tax=Glycomyces sp. NPDC049804 TaxID=3154363 RepID=UPI00342EC722
MTSLVNIAGVLAFAAVVAAMVAVGLRLFIPAEPQGPSTARLPKGRRRVRRLLAAAGVLAAVALMSLAFEVRFAYGAPHGQRGDETVEVVRIGECGGPSVLRFGLARTCELRSYRVEGVGADDYGSIDVISGGALRPGDRVAAYTASGWGSSVLFGADGTRWHPVEAEGRPDLAWLPTAVLVATAVGWQALDRAVSRGRSS